MAELGQLYYTLTAKDEGLAKVIADAKKEFQGMDNAILKLNKTDSTGKLNAAFAETGKTIEQVKSQLSILQMQWNKLEFGDSAARNAVISEYEKLSKVLDKAGTSMDKMIASKNKVSAFAMPDRTMGDISSKISSLKTERLTANPSDLSKYNDAITELIKKHKELESSTNIAIQPQRTLKEALSMEANTLTQVSEKISELKRLRNEQNKTDVDYISNMSKISQAEKQLIQQQKQASSIGLNRVSAFSLPENTMGAISSKISALKTERMNVPFEDIAKYNDAINKSTEKLKALESVADLTYKSQRTLNEVLSMESNTLNQVTAKLAELKRVRGEQSMTDSNYVSNMSRIMQSETALRQQQQQSLEIGIKKETVEQRLNNVLSQQPKTLEQIVAAQKELNSLYGKIDVSDISKKEQIIAKNKELATSANQYGMSLKNSSATTYDFTSAMAMQATTLDQVKQKMSAIAAARLQENIKTEQGKKNVAALTSEYNKLEGVLERNGVKSRNLNADLLGQGRIMSQLKSYAAMYISVFSAANFLSSLVNITGQFEMQKVALASILQDSVRASYIFKEIQDLGLKSPFTTLELTGYTKQLAAYQIQTNDLFDTTRRLADLSSGLGVDMGRLVLAYGQVKAASVLRGQELRQFTEAGLPMVDALAKKFSELNGRVVTTGEVFDLISKKQVSFEMVKNILWDMTDAGGKFYNMQEKIADTTYGKINNLKDAWQKQLDLIGSSNKGIINFGLDISRYLIDNLNTVGTVLTGIITLYGIHTAAVLADRAATMATKLATEGLTAAQISNKIVSTAAEKAQRILNITTLNNPYVKVGAAVLSLIAVMYLLIDNTDAATKAQNAFSNSIENQTKMLDELQSKTESLVSTIKDETSTQYQKQVALEELQKLMPYVFKNMDIEKIKLMDILQLNKLINKEIDKKAEIGTKTNIVLTQNEITKLEKIKEGIKSGKIGTGSDKATRIKELDDEINIQKDVLNKFQDNLAKIQQSKSKAAFSELPKGQQLSINKGNAEALKKEIDRMEAEKAKVEKEGGFYSFTSILQAKQDQYKVLQSKVNALSKGESKTIKADVDEALSNIKRLKNEVANLRSGKTKSVNAYEDIKKTEEDLKDWQDRYNKLTGTTPKGIKSADNKAKREAEAKARIESETIQRKKDLLVMQAEISKIEADAQLEIAQTSIDAMDDGFAKRRAQIALNYEKDFATASKSAADYLAKIQKESDKQYLIENPKGKNAPVVTYGTLSKEQKSTYESYFNIATDKQITDTNNAIKELLAANEDFKTQLEQREKQYNDTVSGLEKSRTEQNSAQIDAALKEAQRIFDEDTSKINLEKLQKELNWGEIFGDLDNIPDSVLQSFSDKLEKFVNAGLSSLSKTDSKTVVEGLTKIQDKLLSNKPFEAMSASSIRYRKSSLDVITAQKKFNEVSKTASKDSKEYADALNNLSDAQKRNKKDSNDLLDSTKKVSEQFNNLFSSINNLGNTLGGTSGEVLNFMSSIGDFAMTSMEGITKLSTAAATSLSTVEKASIILTIISAAISLMKQLDSLLPTSYAKYENYAEKIKNINMLKQAVDDYKIAVSEANYEENNWFGGDNLSGFRDKYDSIVLVKDAYDDLLTSEQAVYKNKSGRGWLTSTAQLLTGQWFTDTVFGTNLTGANYQKAVTSAMDNLRIETRKASKGFLGSGIGGKSQKTEDLRQWVKENLGADLFDEDNKLNEKVYQELMDKYSDKLVGQTKETLEQLKEYQDQYNEYIKELKDYVDGLYSPLVENMTDSLWDWLNNGKDALDSFKDYADDTFKDIINDMMQTIVLKEVFGSFQDDIEKLYESYATGSIDEAKLAESVSTLAQTLLGNYEEQLPGLKQLLESLTTTINSAGFNIGSDSSRTGISTGISTASQDSIEALTGGVYALMDISATSRNNLQAINASTSNMSLELQNQTVILTAISQINASIDARLEKVRVSVDNMNLSGIKLKS